MPELTQNDDPREAIARGNELYGKLDDHEIFWRDRQPWLQERGYVLRPRYQKDWKPSWVGTEKAFWAFEDGQSSVVCPCFARMYESHFDASLQLGTVLDATREVDGLRVTLKTVDTSVHPYEAEIGQHLMSKPLGRDPRNHCVRIIEVLQDPLDPRKKIIVMPLLKLFYRPSFTTVGEVVAFLKQAIEVCAHIASTVHTEFSDHQGLHFMHDNNIAHRYVGPLGALYSMVNRQFQRYLAVEHYDGCNTNVFKEALASPGHDQKS